MPEASKSVTMKQEENISKIGRAISSKRSRSTFFLVITALLILGLNSLLPTIQGNTHYTVEAVEMTYIEYIQIKENEERYSLTWASNQKVKQYLERYAEENPELGVEELEAIEPPDAMTVHVFTKFFYQYQYWYLSTITNLLSAIALFYAIFNFLITRMKDTYEPYIHLVSEMDTMNDTILEPNTFEKWMDLIFNRRRRIAQHKNNIRWKIDKLERRTNFKVKRTYKDYFNKKDPGRYHPKWYQIRYRRYFRKRSKLAELMDQDYINHYVVNGKVRYFKYIHPMFVYNGTNIEGHIVDEYSDTRSDGAQLLSDAGVKIIISLTFTLLLAVLVTVTAVVSAGQSPGWIILNIFAKLLPLFIQIPLAFDYTNTYMWKHLMKNLRRRRSIGLRYKDDMDHNVSLEDPLEKKEVKQDAEENISRDRHADTSGSQLGDVTKGHSVQVPG